jgi:CRISPR-associated protein Csb1
VSSPGRVIGYEDLVRWIDGPYAALRARVRLQPAGGPGDKVFPPTYEERLYAQERRLVDGRVEDAVLLDSVASQANRMELALLAAADARRLTLPLLWVDFAGAGLPEVGRITSLEAPHRIADAILRDSLLDGVPFRQSGPGRAFEAARLTYATPLLRYCPTALLFGVWDSTGALGGLGAKFPRALAAEIVGFGAVPGRRVFSRVDPLQISRDVEVYQAQPGKGAPGGWTLDPEEAAKGTRQPERLRASEVNLGNVTPSVEDAAGGVTIREAVHTAVLSLSGLRRLRFPPELGVPSDPAWDTAARALLVALGLVAVTLAFEAGYDLRSRCVLVPVEPLRFEALRSDGGEGGEVFSLPSQGALALFQHAVERVREAGLPWPAPGEEAIRLTPAAQLVELVRRSHAVFGSEGA